jgi:mRNA-degrading endonuclease RelE of RelBE toxin-antitoxin system
MDKTLKQTVGIAIGEASMCWNPRPSTEVFNSDEAIKINEELLSSIQQLVEEAVKELEESKGKAIRSAERVGKEGTNNGPFAQARIDGYNCAMAEIREVLQERGLLK